MKLLAYLKSIPFVLYVTLATVLFLTPNTYYVYYSFSVFISPYRELASAGVALIVAASIMIYTLRNNEKVAYYFSLFEIVISAYYYISTIGWDWGLVPGLGFTVMLPLSVYFYTKELEVKEGTELHADASELLKKHNEKELINNLSEIPEVKVSSIARGGKKEFKQSKPISFSAEMPEGREAAPSAEEMIEFLNKNPTKRPGQFKRK